MKRPALVFLLIALAGCAPEYRHHESVPLRGVEAPRYLGRWYDIDGRLALLVTETNGAYTATFYLPHPPENRAVLVEAVSKGLRISVERPRRTEEVLLRRVELLDSPHDPDACLFLCQYSICHEPPPGWIARGMAERELSHATARAEAFVDWLVRVL